MASAGELPTTQRAYTLRLRPIVDKNDDRETADGKRCELNDALWATHEAVNRGAKVFGEWLLTLRGGLDHKLADEGPSDQRQNRRILLALSWLSVEDTLGAPRDESLIVTTGTESKDCRSQKLCDALAEILRLRGVPEEELGNPQLPSEQQSGTWIGDCGSSLAAKIRHDAVWIDRSGMFDALANGWDKSKARNDAHTLLTFILSETVP